MAIATTLKDRYEEVRGRIERAAERSGRSAGQILLVAVTKYTDLERVRELLHLGHRDFGESRVQQLVQRASMIEEYLSRVHAAQEVAAEHDPSAAEVPDAARWHLIGRLQRNKVKKAIEHARLIHSIDSLRLAEEIHTIAMRKDVAVDVLLQVNSSGEGQKAGVTPPAALHVAEQIDTMVHVRLRGVMTMGPNVSATGEEEGEIRSAFERTREVFEDIQKAGYGGETFNILSMGMSGDFELGIEHGSNCVRIGSAIFGEGGADGAEDENEGDGE